MTHTGMRQPFNRVIKAIVGLWGLLGACQIQHDPHPDRGVQKRKETRSGLATVEGLGRLDHLSSQVVSVAR